MIVKFKSTPTSYYMHGIHPVLSALNNPDRKIVKILCTQKIFSSNQNLVNKFNYEIIDIKVLDKILGQNANHQGIAAKVESIFLNNLKDLNDIQDNCKLAILDQITDSYNIGSIIRSAAAFGISYILLPTDHSPIENSNIAKAACGTLEVVKIIKIVNIANSIEHLKKLGFWIVGLDAHAQNLTDQAQSLFTGKIAVVLGSEDKGMRSLTKKACDFLVKIPMKSNVESLNVSNTAAIMFYNLFI